MSVPAHGTVEEVTDAYAGEDMLDELTNRLHGRTKNLLDEEPSQ